MLFTGLFAPSKASAVSGNEFLEECRAMPAICQIKVIYFFGGFGSGITEAHGHTIRKYGINSDTEYTDIAGYCTSGLNISDGQIKDVVVYYLENNPQYRHEDISDLMISALRDSFPCN